MQVAAAGFTHVGRRSNNEDALCVEPGLGLFLVADGIGGYEGGEVASALVVSTVREFVARNAADDDATWPFALSHGRTFGENLIACATRLAHREVCVRKVGRLAAMGATLAAVIVRPGEVVVAHVGDSRVYRLRDGRLDRMTQDHSLAELFRLRGGPCPEGMNHVVTRAIGQIEDAVPDTRSEAPRAGDVYLICSDGVTDPLGDDEIADALGRRTPVDAARELVDRAYAAGGSDNITAVVLALQSDKRP